MIVNLTCPTCGHSYRATAQAAGEGPRCPACLNTHPAQAPPSSLLSRAPEPAGGPPPNRTVLADPEGMIRYTCPRCKSSLESPASFAGQKLNCPDCNQRLQIPRPSSPPLPPPNKTVLAEEERAAPPAAPARPPQVPADELEVVEERAPRSGQAPREHCLECGRDVTSRAKVQTCSDCGSLFCSAGCYREHRDHAHPKKRQKQAREVYVECKRCGSTERPRAFSAISEGGWVTFVVLLILFFPLCWIGLLITETRYECVECGARTG